MTFSIFLKLVL